MTISGTKYQVFLILSVERGEEGTRKMLYSLLDHQRCVWAHEFVLPTVTKKKICGASWTIILNQHNINHLKLSFEETGGTGGKAVVSVTQTRRLVLHTYTRTHTPTFTRLTATHSKLTATYHQHSLLHTRLLALGIIRVWWGLVGLVKLVSGQCDWVRYTGMMLAGWLPIAYIYIYI